MHLPCLCPSAHRLISPRPAALPGRDSTTWGQQSLASGQTTLGLERSGTSTALQVWNWIWTLLRWSGVSHTTLMLCILNAQTNW